MCMAVHEIPETVENFALESSTTQSSTYPGSGSERANDGNSDSDFRHGSCARTYKSRDPWWRVDLNESYNVSDVRITNRADCCSEHLVGAEIRIGDSLEKDGNFNRLLTRFLIRTIETMESYLYILIFFSCGIVDSVSVTTLTFNCGGYVGRYVNIIIPGPDQILTLCEVEIFGAKLPHFRGKENVAFGKPSTQSSAYRWAGARRANDGNSDTDFTHGSCTRTWKSKNPWWRVDLLEIFNVSDVRITNRADCCSDRLRGAEIRIGNSLANDGNSNGLYLFRTEAKRLTCFLVGMTETVESHFLILISFSCGIVDSVSVTKLIFNCGGLVGRYVNIIIPGQKKILHLCEVEIFGTEHPSLPGTGTLNFPQTLSLCTASNRIWAKMAPACGDFCKAQDHQRININSQQLTRIRETAEICTVPDKLHGKLKALAVSRSPAAAGAPDLKRIHAHLKSPDPTEERRYCTWNVRDDLQGRRAGSSRNSVAGVASSVSGNVADGQDFRSD
ncbi:uncharacterized protein LOC129706218 [Leucoraja erinacea]|uniref:uncharacterized protein LOC129706218 n=1 Tax=Leucoraja erinaceus TaxID=7782 RepID=UPI0024543768|nr:uncharacterized protein LOC129706218 [Leucoraja erinacea]